MKRVLSLLLSAILLMSLLMAGVGAVDDAIGLHYTLSLQAEQPEDGESFPVGGVCSVTVTLSSDGSAEAGLYGIQFSLSYDPLLLRLEQFTPGLPEGTEYRMDEQTGTLTVVYLDRELSGKLIPAESEAAVLTFTALRDGKAAVKLTNFVLTNADATVRSTDMGGDITVPIGTTVLTVDKAALQSRYLEAKALLEDTVIRQNGSSVSPGSYYVWEADAQALQTVLTETEAALNNPDIGQYAVNELYYRLQNALTSFSAVRQYQRKRNVMASIITVQAVCGEHGKISEEYVLQKVYAGTSVTVISIPDEGYEVDYAVINGRKCEADTLLTLQSVTSDTKIEIFFRMKLPFTDVAPDAWYAEAVRSMAEQGIIRGVTETLFGPNQTVTRAMAVTLLYRLSGETVTADTQVFEDVTPDSWYGPAVQWAKQAGVVNGLDAKRFGPSDYLTRQQLATMLLRFSAYMGMDVSGRAELSGYTDAAETADYAAEAMSWACACGILQGVSKTELAPAGVSTRAQLAVMLQRWQNLQDK